MIRQGFVSNSSSSSFIVYYDKTNKTPMTKKFWKEDKYYGFSYINGKRDKEDCYEEHTITLPFTDGNMEFGWEWDSYKDFYSKVNYVFYQAFKLEDKVPKYLSHASMYHYRTPSYELSPMEVVIEAIRDIYAKMSGEYREKLCITIDYNLLFSDGVNKDDKEYNIDHQSILGANTDDLEIYRNTIFHDKDRMTDFLLHSDFYIQGGNDNVDDYPSSWKEAWLKSGGENFWAEWEND